MSQVINLDKALGDEIHLVSQLKNAMYQEFCAGRGCAATPKSDICFCTEAAHLCVDKLRSLCRPLPPVVRAVVDSPEIAVELEKEEEKKKQRGLSTTPNPIS